MLTFLIPVVKSDFCKSIRKESTKSSAPPVLLPLGAFVWKTFKKWCSMSVRSSGDCCDFCLYQRNMGHRNWVRLPKKLKVLILEPSSLNFLQARLYRLFFNFFQKLQKSPRVVSGGKMRKRKQKGSIPQCKNVQKYIFLETRTLDLRQINVTETSLLKLFHTRAPRGHLALRV